MRWIVLAGAYVILWFLALQILLPVGIGTPQEGAESVGDPGAPANPRILMKALLATVAAGAIWMIFYVLVLTRIIDI